MNLIHRNLTTLGRDGISYLTTLIHLMRWKVALVLGLMISQSLTECIGLLMLVPLLHLVGVDVDQRSLCMIDQILSSIFAAVGVTPTLVTVLGLFVLLTTVHGVISRLQKSVGAALQYEFVAS